MKSGSDWPQMGQIQDFFLDLSEPKYTCTEICSEKKVPGLSHLGVNLTQFVPKSGHPDTA